MNARFPYPKEARLLATPEFRAVFDAKQSISDSRLVLYAVFNRRDVTRVGLSVSKKLGNAVTRNVYKRRLRDAFRLCRPNLPVGLDLVLIPRHRNDIASSREYQTSLQALMTIWQKRWLATS